MKDELEIIVESRITHVFLKSKSLGICCVYECFFLVLSLHWEAKLLVVARGLSLATVCGLVAP